MDTTWDCIVVGGGAAGLSAALVLGRARRRTLLLDTGAQSNRAAHAMGGMLGQDGRRAADFYAAGRAELSRYPAVEVRDVAATAGAREGETFVLDLAGGAQERAATVLLATGMDYRPPDLPGIAEHWGRSVFHCPFCHGWEHRERPLAALGDGSGAIHRGLLLTAWSDEVTMLDGALDAEARAALVAAGVRIEDREVAAVRGDGDALAAVVLADGSELSCEGLLVPVTLHQRSPLAAQLGAELAPPTPLSSEGLATTGMGMTSVPGLFAAGDATGQMPSVANVVASGSNAAAAIVGHLTGAA